MSEQYRKDNLGYEITKLEKQLKLLNELDLLWEKQSKYINNAQKSMEINTKIMETQRKLEQQGIKNIQNQNDLNEKAEELDKLRNIKWDERLRIDHELEKARKREIADTEKLRQKDEERARQKEENRRKEARAEADRYKNQTASSKLLDQIAAKEEDILMKSKRKTEAARQRQLENNKELQQLKEKLRLEEKNERRQNKSSESIKSSINSLKIPGLGTVGQLKEFGELNTSAKLISVAADTFNEAVNQFSRLFTQGLNNISGKANTQFQNISVRTGMSYDTYKNGVAAMGRPGGTLSNWNGYNLQDNIRTSDVQDMMNTLANQGVGQEQLFASAIDTVLTKNIVPYLDLTTAEMQQFNQNVNGELMKQVRGISKLNQEIYDSNVVATQYLQDQLNYLAPMSSVAEIDLMKGSAEGMDMLQKLQSKGMSLEGIAKLQKNTRAIQDDWVSALNSNDRSLQLAAIGVATNGINPYTDYSGVLNQTIKGASTISGMSPGDGVLASIFNNAMGGDRYTYELSQLMKQGKLTSDDINNLYSNAKNHVSNLSNYSNAATQLFASGANQTAQQKQEITLENLSSDLAMWKTDMGVWFDVLTTAVKGIATILITWAAGKVASGIGGKLFGGAGKHAAGGMLGNVGGNLAKASGGTIMGSSGLATAVGAAGVTAGIAGAAYGISKGAGQLQEGETGLGVTNIAGGAAAGVGAAMLLASNPVGWAVGIVGGLAMLGAAAYESANAYKEGGKIVKAQYEGIRASYKQEISDREDLLYNIQDNLKNEETVEDARKDLINSGMLTEEELQKAQNASKEELEKLTEQYIISTGKFSESVDEITDKYGNIAQQDTNEVNKSIRDWYNANKNNKNDTNKNMMEKMVFETVAALNEKTSNGGSLSKDEQWFLDEYNKNMSKGRTSQQDYEWLLDKGNNLSVFYANVTGQRLENVTRYAANNGANGIKSYEYDDPNEVMRWMSELRTAIDTNDKTKAEAALKGAKEARLSKDKYSEIGEAVDKFGLSYRVGTDSIPYDNYPALLHEGEAVLTASTANELRGLIDEYREAKSDSIKITQAIQEQTTVLVERLDAIYTKMPSSSETQAQEIMPGRLNQNVRNMTSYLNQ